METKKDEVLIVPRTAAQLAFNLGFVRLALRSSMRAARPTELDCSSSQ